MKMFWKIKLTGLAVAIFMSIGFGHALPQGESSSIGMGIFSSAFWKSIRGSSEGELPLVELQEPEGEVPIPEPAPELEPENSTCEEHSLENFPDDLFTMEQRRHGAALLHLLCGLYWFLLTATVCNSYLLPALDCICADLNISTHVAGATFLAIASCFPELFVNVVGTFLTKSDIGVGTVVGGAVFNTFATPAVGALAATQGIQLKWRVITRGCLIYVLSVSTLVIVMWDGIVTVYEAVTLMLLFTSYFTCLLLSRKFVHWRKAIERHFSRSNERKSTASIDDDDVSGGMYKPSYNGELIMEYRKSISKRASKLQKHDSKESSTTVTEDLQAYQPESIFVRPSGTLFQKLCFLLRWPVRFVLFITIPDSRYKCFRKWYPLTFVMCISWIAASSYMVSWMMTIVGDTLAIPDSIMGLTILAAGGNMPEMVSIVILSRQGSGDMAMSNTLGSNTLDILLCLGLPWTIKTLSTGKDVHIVSGVLAYSVLSIVVCVVGFYIALVLSGFVLNKKVGAACLVMYPLFLVFAILSEANLIYGIDWPKCS